MLSSPKIGALPIDNPLDAYRRRAGWSYTQLAEKLAVTPWSAARYCRPLNDPDFRVPAAAIAAKLPGITEGAVHIGLMLPLPERAENRRERKEAS